MATNCIIIEDDISMREALEEYIADVPSLNLIGSVSDPLSALALLSSHTIHLLILDIEMPQMDGISFVKSLESPPLFLFITGHSKYAVTSYDMGAVDYIVKPFPKKRFLKAIDRVEKLLQKESENHTFIRITEKNKSMFISYEDILFLQGMKDFVKIIKSNTSHITLGTIKSFEEVLPKDIFIRIHKSFIVNLTKISSVEKSFVNFRDFGIKLPIGKKFRSNFLNKITLTKNLANNY